MNLAHALIDLHRRVSWLENNHARNEQGPTLERQEFPSGTRDFSQYPKREGPELVELPKKDYEILAFRATKDYGLIRKHEVHETLNTDSYLHMGRCVYDGHWEIFRVKRLSDGTVWELGQDITYDHKRATHGNIHKFILLFGVMFAHFIDNEGDECEKEMKDWRAYAVSYWEIVEFKAKAGTRCLNMFLTPKGGYCNSDDAEGPGLELKEMLYGARSAEDGQYTIHAVRRSDGQVFRVGDVVRHKVNESKSYKITDFNFDDDGMYANSVEFPKRGMLIDLIQLDKPLFTTVDGVPVYKCDKVWFMPSFKSPDPVERFAEDAVDITRHYSTKEAALLGYEDWLYGQEVLSLDDIRTMISDSDDLEAIVNFLKEKIAKG